jgi:excisionase family DNA binding protein
MSGDRKVVVMPKNPLPRRWLSQLEAADQLGVTDRTIRNYISRGWLKGYRPRGSRIVRIDSRELDSFMQPIPTADPQDAA